MTDAPGDPTTPPWTVERWGGQDHHKERVLFSGTEAEARAEYERLRVKIDVRQGTLRLRRPDGVTEKVESGPRLRTRW